MIWDSVRTALSGTAIMENLVSVGMISGYRIKTGIHQRTVLGIGHFTIPSHWKPGSTLGAFISLRGSHE